MEDNIPMLRKCFIGDLIIEDDEPMLRIDTYKFNNNDWVLDVEGYVWLIPFEGCSFRVSKNKDGNCPIGSTKIMGLGNITQCTFYDNTGWQFNHSVYIGCIKVEILRCAAIAAVSEFCSIEKIIPPLMEDTDKDSLVSEFIKQVIKWVDYNFYDKFYIRPW